MASEWKTERVSAVANVTDFVANGSFEWRDTTLGEFVGLQRGHDLTDPQRRIGRVPVMGSAGQNGFHDTALAKGPGIVVGRSGASFGQVHFSPVDYWPHNTALYVTDRNVSTSLRPFFLQKYK